MIITYTTPSGKKIEVKHVTTETHEYDGVTYTRQVDYAEIVVNGETMIGGLSLYNHPKHGWCLAVGTTLNLVYVAPDAMAEVKDLLDNINNRRAARDAKQAAESAEYVRHCRVMRDAMAD